MQLIIKKISKRLAVILIRFIYRLIRKLRKKLSIIIITSNNNNELLTDIHNRIRFYAPDIPAENIIFSKRIITARLLSGDCFLNFEDLGRFKKKFLSLFPNAFSVDHRRSISGWEWVRFANYYSNHKIARKESKRIFDSLIGYLDSLKLSKVYIFGTGPSLANAFGHNWSDGYRIVCNTIVRDAELYNYLNPHVIVAGDAVYHFSHASFACQFRKDLLERMCHSDVFFLYPEQFDVIVRREFKPFSKRLIPVISGGPAKIHTNLALDFRLPSLGNVLSLLLLPIACTLSKDVKLWGFDGRSPVDNHNPFWANSEKHSYSELMPGLRVAFPYFYQYFVPNNDSKKYIQSVHGDVLDAHLGHAESEGWNFEMLHPSWTPTLHSRYHGNLTPEDYYNVKVGQP